MMHIQNTNFNQVDAIKNLLYFLQKIGHDVSRMTSPELKESKNFFRKVFVKTCPHALCGVYGLWLRS